MQQASKALSASQTCCAYVCAAGLLLEKDQGVHPRRSHCCSPCAVRVAPGPLWLPPIRTQLQFAPPCTRKNSLCQAMVAHKCLRVGACSLWHQGRITLRVLNPCFKIHHFQEAAACKIAASDFMQTHLPCLKGPHPLCRMTISCQCTLMRTSRVLLETNTPRNLHWSHALGYKGCCMAHSSLLAVHMYRVSLKQLLLHKSWDCMACHKQVRYEQWKCHTLVFHFPLEVQRNSRQFSKCSLTESLQRSACFGSFVLIEVSVTFVTTSFKTPTSAVKALPSLWQVLI